MTSALTTEAVVDRVLDSLRGDEIDTASVADHVRQAHEALERAGLAVVDALTIPAETAEARVECPVCSGEGVVGGLVVSSNVAAVDEVCGRCKGVGTVPADDADLVPWEPVT